MVKPCVLRRHVSVTRLHSDDGQTRQSCEVVGDVTMCLTISFPIIRQGLELATKYGGGSVECRDMAGWLLHLMPVQVVVNATVADVHTLRMFRKRSGTRSRFFFCNNVGWQQNKRENGLCKQPGSLRRADGSHVDV